MQTAFRRLKSEERVKSGPRVTRADVARAAKVSLATVTYALDGSGKIRIGAATCARIQKLAERMGYRPNYVRRALAAGRTYAMGFVVPQQKSLLFPFYELIIDGCSARMNDDDYDPLLLARLRWDRVAKVARDGRVDGLFMLQSDFDDRPIRQAAAMGLPVVVLNRDLPEGLESDQVACVYSDHHQMMSSVVDELVGLGCRNLLNYNETQTVFANRKTLEGFNLALARHEAKGVVGHTIEPVWGATGSSAEAIFSQGCPWDGIFVNGSMMMDELVRAARVKGFEPGRDFQLISTDAFPETESYEQVVPRVRQERTVYWQQPRLVGEEGWRRMAALLSGAKGMAREVCVPYRREAMGAG